MSVPFRNANDKLVAVSFESAGEALMPESEALELGFESTGEEHVTNLSVDDQGQTVKVDEEKTYEAFA